MKTLENYTLLYDDDCPLCRVYTRGFIAAEMLDKNGKKPYCNLSEEEQNFIDVKRASNEIALIDTKNKTVLYGIDSLLKVIGFSFPWMQKVGYWKPINYFLKKLYKLISFNRKVIVPSKINKEFKLQCVPDFNFKYRYFYIIFTIIISSSILSYFLKFVPILKQFNFFQIVIFESLLLILNFGILQKLNTKIVLNWIGNLQTSIFIGSLLSLPFYSVNYFFKLPIIVNDTVAILLLLFIISDGFRRFKLIKINLV